MDLALIVRIAELSNVIIEVISSQILVGIVQDSFIFIHLFVEVPLHEVVKYVPLSLQGDLHYCSAYLYVVGLLVV